MSKFFLAVGLLFVFFKLSPAQNIFSGEPVQVVGAFNGYSTTPYSGYRVSTYRRVSLSSGTPTDGRGQWTTTINVQPTGGDVTPINMPGGGGNGFLFISGPAANRFQNKWVFSGIGQGSVDAFNGISAFNSGNDMGLNMSVAGHYTFVFSDCGYTQTNARYYVGRTTNTPVGVTRASQTFNGDTSLTVNITASAPPSPEEKIYARYTTGADFSGTGSSTVVQASGSGTSYTATIPPQLGIVRYYVFTSTLSLAQLSAAESGFLESPLATESEKNLGVLRYDDNAGGNYVYNGPTASALSIGGAARSGEGRPIKGATATLTDFNGSGRREKTYTDALGRYQFDGVEAGRYYLLELSHPRYSFIQRLVFAGSSLDDVDFTGEWQGTPRFVPNRRK